MVRAGRNPDGSWYLGRGRGRGVWWCDDPRCAAALRASHAARALRAAVTDEEAAALRGAGVREKAVVVKE